MSSRRTYCQGGDRRIQGEVNSKEENAIQIQHIQGGVNAKEENGSAPGGAYFIWIILLQGEQNFIQETEEQNFIQETEAHTW